MLSHRTRPPLMLPPCAPIGVSSGVILQSCHLMQRTGPPASCPAHIFVDVQHSILRPPHVQLKPPVCCTPDSQRRGWTCTFPFSSIILPLSSRAPGISQPCTPSELLVHGVSCLSLDHPSGHTFSATLPIRRQPAPYENLLLTSTANF